MLLPNFVIVTSKTLRSLHVVGKRMQPLIKPIELLFTQLFMLLSNKRSFNRFTRKMINIINLKLVKAL